MNMNKPILDLPTLYKNNATGTGWWKVSLPDDEPPGFLIEYAKSDTAKSVTKFHPTVAKNINRSNQTTGWEQAVLEAESKWRKQLDKGYTVDKPEAGTHATNTLGYVLPMLAKKKKDVKHESVDFTHAYVQPKLDGNRALKGASSLYSRGGKVFELPHLNAAVESQCPDILVDGEIYKHDSTLQQINSWIKDVREESECLEYWIYDVVDMSLPFHERIKKIPALIGHLKLVPTVKVNSWEEVMQLHKKYIAQGYEGTILRWGEGGYESDKRSKFLIKIKDYQDAEFRIIGAKEGVPYTQFDGARQLIAKYTHCVYICQTETGQTFDCSAPGTMYQKDAAWKAREIAIGKLLKVNYWNLIDGVPQQPTAADIREQWDMS